jgi:hypothetical protein
VDELVQRHKRDVQKANGDQKTKQNKDRHGYNFSGETRGNSGRPPRLSPDRKRLRWSNHHEVNFLEGAEVNCLLEHEQSSFITIVVKPEDPEKSPPGSTGPPPPGHSPNDSDMEEAPCRPLMTLCQDSSLSLTPKTSSTTKSRHWRVFVYLFDKCPSFELGDKMSLMIFLIIIDNLQYFY